MVLAFKIILFLKEREKGRQRYDSCFLCLEGTIFAVYAATIGPAQGF